MIMRSELPSLLLRRSRPLLPFQARSARYHDINAAALAVINSPQLARKHAAAQPALASETKKLKLLLLKLGGWDIWDGWCRDSRRLPQSGNKSYCDNCNCDENINKVHNIPEPCVQIGTRILGGSLSNLDKKDKGAGDGARPTLLA